MFKFRKKKLVQHVVRVEDLQVGDLLHLNHDIVKPIVEIRELKENERTFPNEPEFVITMENLPPNTTFAKLHTVVLYGNMNVIVQK